MQFSASIRPPASPHPVRLHPARLRGPKSRGLFTDDYFALIGQRAQQWARDAIEIAAAPFEQATANERNLGIGPGVIGALAEMLNEIANMELPPNTSMQNPQPPGGTGGRGGS
jgi:hypothetical protein